MKKYTTADRLNQIMSERNMKQVDILNLTKPYCEKYKVKLGRNDLSQYVSGKVTPRQTKVYILARALNVSEAWLMGFDAPMEREEDEDDTTAHNIPSNIVPINPNTEFVPIPIIGTVAAGMNCTAEENIIGYEPMLKSDLKGGGDFTFLTVQGDSMYPEFKEGDLAFVRLQKSVDSGSYAVVLIDGDEGVIKKIVYGDDWIELRSINPMYPPRRFEGADVTRVEVYGLVKDLKRKFN